MFYYTEVHLLAHYIKKKVMLVVLKALTILKTLHVNVADINATFISGHAQILSASHLLRRQM
jgi:type IV secretory pathway TrbL component